MAMLFTALSILHVTMINSNNDIDYAIHAQEGKLSDLLIYEGDEPVDAIMRWIKDTSKEHHPLARGPIHLDLINEVCGSEKFTCSRKRAWEQIDMGHIVYRNQIHNITYVNPGIDVSEKAPCLSIPGVQIDSCIYRQAVEICGRLVPKMPNCENLISVHINREMKRFQKSRITSKNSYTVLGLEMDVNGDELFKKTAYLVREHGLNFSPYKRVDNGTDPYPNSMYIHKSSPGKLAYAFVDAYIKVKDEESREWHDKPCTPMFGGALCGKKDKVCLKGRD